MVRVAVFQHVAHEPLGTFHPLLKDAGLRIRYFNFGREHHDVADLGRYDALVVLGGPMGVYEADRHAHLRDEVDAIRRALDRDLPVLGICLGAQLLASALGAQVHAAGVKEIGWFDVSLNPLGAADKILGGLRPSERIFQWHGDTFELPRGAELLASSELFAHQAYRYGSRAYGFQFHMEVDQPMIERWLKVPVNAADLASVGGAAHAARILAETPAHLPRLAVASRQVFREVIRLFGGDPSPERGKHGLEP